MNLEILRSFLSCWGSIRFEIKEKTECYISVFPVKPKPGQFIKMVTAPVFEDKNTFIIQEFSFGNDFPYNRFIGTVKRRISKNQVECPGTSPDPLMHIGSNLLRSRQGMFVAALTGLIAGCAAHRGADVTFPAPRGPGFVVRYRIDRVGGIGPWAS
jgi:hypothetical protein